jgi:hypothetical protein
METVSVIIKAKRQYPDDEPTWDKIGFYHENWNILLHLPYSILELEKIKKYVKNLGYVIKDVRSGSETITLIVRREEWMTNILVIQHASPGHGYITYSIDERDYIYDNYITDLSEQIKSSLSKQIYINPDHTLFQVGTHKYAFVSKKYHAALCNIYYSRSSIAIPIFIISDFSPKYFINIEYIVYQLNMLGYRVEKKDITFEGETINVSLSLSH